MKNPLLSAPVLLLTFLFLPAGPATASEPVPPGLFTLSDPELEVTVWAASPLFCNPTNMDIDKDGCIWVAEGVNYRKNFNRRPEGDRIMVLRDNDGDGKADESWPFVQEPFLRAPLGVAVIGNKVVVSMTPDLVVYTDINGDKRFNPADGDTREVLLTGFNGRNHDHSLHSITVGPDGKWYFSAGNCGAVFTDKSGKTFRIASSQNYSWWPKDPDRPDWDPNEFAGQKSDDGKVYIGGFIARMEPDGSGVEILAHNLRNSYENCVTSGGVVFANDNDDQPACRTFAVLQGGNYGFASADGKRTWQADRRPGQDLKIATWRQEDPGVAPAGDVYGGGAPTGIVFYERGALGQQHEGTLLSCESARNTIFGYKPVRMGAGWKLDRFDFLTTNRDGRIVGTDFTGGAAKADPSDTKTLFRPSDISVGPDGAVYISDWLDPRVGGHADMDESVSGTIYRVAPKGFKSVIPKIELSTPEGAKAALLNPAVHVRAEAATALSSRHGVDPVPLLQNADVLRKQETPAPPPSTTAWPDPTDTAAILHFLAGAQPSQKYAELLPKVGHADPLQWSPLFTVLAWQLHPPESINPFKIRALSPALPLKDRRNALTAIGYNDSPEASAAMLEVVRSLNAGTTPDHPDSLIRETAIWWLLNRKDHAWKDHGLAAALKEQGIYDPDKVQWTATALPDPPAPAFPVGEALKLQGDPVRGAAVSQRCYMCHRFAGGGTEVGPDMTTWGQTQGIEVILRSLIEPNADIAHGFEASRIEMQDGALIDGMVLADSDPIVIRSLGGLTQMLPRQKIKSKKNLGRSLMMNAAQLGLTAQECADLAAFLRR